MCLIQENGRRLYIAQSEIILEEKTLTREVPEDMHSNQSSSLLSDWLSLHDSDRIRSGLVHGIQNPMQLRQPQKVPPASSASFAWLYWDGNLSSARTGRAYAGWHIWLQRGWREPSCQNLDVTGLIYTIYSTYLPGGAS